MDNEKPSVVATKPPQKVHMGLLVGLLIVVVLAVGIIAMAHHYYADKASHNIAETAPAEVSITSNGFVPATTIVKVDQPVVWTNNDTATHIVASDPYPKDDTLSGLNSHVALGRGQTYTYVFRTKGTFTYHDNLNPYTLKGIVIVK